MTDNPRIKRALLAAIGPSIALLVLATILGYAAFGPTGFYAWGDYNQSLEIKKKMLVQLKIREAELANRRDLLNPDRVDPDMADELVRRELNVSRKDEIIIPLEPDSADTPAKPVRDAAER